MYFPYIPYNAIYMVRYIRRINTYIRKYGIRIRRGEAGKYGIYTAPYNTYNYIYIYIIRIRFWPTLDICIAPSTEMASVGLP